MKVGEQQMKKALNERSDYSAGGFCAFSKRTFLSHAVTKAARSRLLGVDFNVQFLSTNGR